MNADQDDQAYEIRQAEFRATVLTKLATLEETLEKVIVHMEAIFKRLAEGDVMFSGVAANQEAIKRIQDRTSAIERMCLECQARRKVTWAAIVFAVTAVGVAGTLIGHFLK